MQLFDIAQFLGAILLSIIGVYAAARFLGLGKCLVCKKRLLPWNADCGKHESVVAQDEPDGQQTS